MDFTQAMQSFIGRTIEVYQATQVVIGILIASGNGSITVQPSGTSYPNGDNIMFFTNQIEFVRFLPA